MKNEKEDTLKMLYNKNYSPVKALKLLILLEFGYLEWFSHKLRYCIIKEQHCSSAGSLRTESSMAKAALGKDVSNQFKSDSASIGI